MPHRIQPGDSVLARYQAMVADGELEADPAQEDIAAKLDRLNGRIANMRLASKSSSLGWFFARKARNAEPVRGLYIHGSVGRGKSMLMDFFYRACPAKRKRRAHFHDFMADIHDRIGAHRTALKEGTVKGDDPIQPVARAVASQARVMCFDEFTVTDITDAMILSRLFTALFAEGVVLIATSNVVPDQLYKDGLNRGLFTPFIDTLKTHVSVVSLDADRDYRQGRASGTPRYMTPLDARAEMAMDAVWAKMTGNSKAKPETVTVKGRDITVPLAANGAARFNFADLCEAPLGARDYLAIARQYPTIMIDDVPVIGDGKRNEAKRFINLIDTLYDNQISLVLSAEAEPDALYQATSGNEAFEFERTASRLIEMRSADWHTRIKVAAQ